MPPQKSKYKIGVTAMVTPISYPFDSVIATSKPLPYEAPPNGHSFFYANFSRSATARASQRLLYSLSAWPFTQTKVTS